MKAFCLAAVLLLAPLALGNYVDLTLDSSTAGQTENISGYVTDDILGVEVAERSSFSGWLYWDGPTFNFAPIDLTDGGELQLNVRYYQETYTWDDDGDPETPDITREAYDDANVWILLKDSTGAYFDLAWAEPPLKEQGDVWQTVTKDLTGIAWGTFLYTEVTGVQVRSTNWSAPPVNNDYLHFSQLTITPEPGTLTLLCLGGLALLRRR